MITIYNKESSKLVIYSFRIIVVDLIIIKIVKKRKLMFYSINMSFLKNNKKRNNYASSFSDISTEPRTATAANRIT